MRASIERRVDQFIGSDTALLVVGGLGLLWLVTRGVGGVAADVAKGAVDAAAGAVTGTVTGASEAIGIPTPADTTTDEHVARWIIDHPRGGQLAASEWSSVAAYAKAQFLAAGSGYPPPAGTKLYAAFPPGVGDTAGIDFGNPGGW